MNGTPDNLPKLSRRRDDMHDSGLHVQADDLDFAIEEIKSLRLELCLLRAPSTTLGAATEDAMRQYAESRGWDWEAMHEG
jgi:hypothetical protein